MNNIYANLYCKQMQIKYMQIIYTYRYTIPFKSLGSVLFVI